MRILVTGGGGYIGSFMTKRLLDDGYEVVVIDNLVRGHAEVIDKRAIALNSDFSDEKSLEDLFSQKQIDSVIHFAGFISMGESMVSPGMYFLNNSFGVVKLLEKMVKHNVKNFIFSSTAGVYGDPIIIPIPEDHPKTPTNPYGQSKLMVEEMLSWYQKIYSLSFISLRYFNASGAALDASMGENHLPETHIIPNAIRCALTQKTFELYGNDYDTTDGTCIRDYIHVLDLVEAHILALKKLEKDSGGYVYNVGVGKGYSNKEVLEMVKKVSGINFLISGKPRREGDANMLIADPTKINQELGFIPKHSDLETIVKTAWEWHSKNAKLNARNTT